MHYDIVVVGGGAGGLELAARLGRKLGRTNGREKVLLIDQSVFHIWKPTLHEVAAGTMDVHQEGLSYPILARRNHFSFSLGRLQGLDPMAKRLTLGQIVDERGEVIVPQRNVTFTYAVLAMGSGSNFFGTPGAEYAYVLEHASDAEQFHKRLLAAFARAAFSAERVMRVAIVGGGATGVELSAELLEAHAEFRESLSAEQRFRLDLTIVEAGPRILAGLPDTISSQAHIALERKGVRVLVATKAIEIQPHCLVTSAGEIDADLIVWAAGIKAADTNADFGLTVNRGLQFVVNDRLQTSAADIFALGDCAACIWEGDRMVPARAAAAHQQALYLSRVLLARLKESTWDRPYVYKDFGSLVSLGENRGVGNLMGGLAGKNFFVEGLIAKWMYMSLHLNHHRAILGTGNTLVLALARLLQRRVSGRLKLH